jgi:hypothetical protein
MKYQDNERRLCNEMSECVSDRVKLGESCLKWNGSLIGTRQFQLTSYVNRPMTTLLSVVVMRYPCVV